MLSGLEYFYLFLQIEGSEVCCGVAGGDERWIDGLCANRVHGRSGKKTERACQYSDFAKER